MSKAKPMQLKMLWLNLKTYRTEPRQTASGDVFVNGLKVKAVSGLDSSKLKNQN